MSVSRRGGWESRASACGQRSSSTRSRSRTATISVATGGTGVSGSRSRTSSHQRVDGVQQTRVVGFGEVRVTGLQFVRVEDDVGGADEGEVGEHTTGRERLFAPAVGQLTVDEGEFVLAHDPREGAAGQDEFAPREEFALLVKEQARAPSQGSSPGSRAASRTRARTVSASSSASGASSSHAPRSSSSEAADSGTHLGGGEHGARRRRESAQLLQQGVGGVGVGDLEAEAGEGVEVAAQVSSGVGPSGSGSRIWRGPMVVRPSASGTGRPESRSGSTPARLSYSRRHQTRVLLQAGQPVHGFGERDAGDTQRPQLHPAFQTGGQQAGDHLGEDAHGVGTGALDDTGVAQPQGVRVLRDLRETDPDPGRVALALGPVRRSVLVLGLRGGGRQEGGAPAPGPGSPGAGCRPARPCRGGRARGR